MVLLHGGECQLTCPALLNSSILLFSATAMLLLCFAFTFLHQGASQSVTDSLVLKVLADDDASDAIKKVSTAGVAGCQAVLPVSNSRHCSAMPTLKPAHGSSLLADVSKGLRTAEQRLYAQQPVDRQEFTHNPPATGLQIHFLRTPTIKPTCTSLYPGIICPQPQVPEVRGRCHSLLYSRGLSLHTCHQPAAARAMLSSALFYTPPGACHAKTARLLAACCAALGQGGAALEYLRHAGRHESPGTACPVGKLLELRILLTLQKAAAPVESPQQDRGACPSGAQAGAAGRGGGVAAVADGQRQEAAGTGEAEGEADCLQRRISKLIASMPLIQSPEGVDVMQVGGTACSSVGGFRDPWPLHWPAVEA